MMPRYVLPSGIYLIGLALAGCASHSLMPATQTAAIRDRERALAPHSETIQAAMRPSGKAGALAFLDGENGRLVVLPGDTPADAWARYTGSLDAGARGVSMPAVVTYVYRADIPKAPETVSRNALQQERTSAAALEADLRRLEQALDQVRGELAQSQQGTDKAVADMRALAEDLATVRKFMLQTAQLGWLNHELTLENTNGLRRMAATGQELAASSARLDETMRQLSENLGTQLKELTTRLDAIQKRIQSIK
jgi:hypothetical protein